MKALRPRLHEEGDEDDPLLSLVNLVDVFLVLAAALLVALAGMPPGLVGGERVTVIRNAGSPDMEVIIRDGQRIERFRGDGGAADARGGTRAGTAWRMPDGSLVFVPE